MPLVTPLLVLSLWLFALGSRVSHRQWCDAHPGRCETTPVKKGAR